MKDHSEQECLNWSTTYCRLGRQFLIRIPL